MLRRIKNIFIVIAMFVLVFWGYVMIVNRNSANMTARQKILKAVYPMFLWLNKTNNKNNTVLTNNKTIPPVSFFSLQVALNDGSVLNMSSLKGKKILLVNTASDCGYTGQYEQLQKLYNQYNSKLVIIGFPANDFAAQEKGNDADIATFCKKNYGVTFPLALKSVVIKTPSQNNIFQWLSDPAKNGWNSKAPSWNFAKYLINEDGVLVNYFGPAVEPGSKEVEAAINESGK